MDGKHTIFGTVLEESSTTLEAIEDCAEVFMRDGMRRARIIKSAIITDCGQL